MIDKFTVPKGWMLIPETIERDGIELSVHLIEYIETDHRGNVSRLSIERANELPQYGEDKDDE